MCTKACQIHYFFFCYSSEEEEEEWVPMITPMPRLRFNAHKFAVNDDTENGSHILLLVPCVIMAVISAVISYHYNCNRWTTVVELCGDAFLVGFDCAFLLYYPKLPSFTPSVLCTTIACFMQMLGSCNQFDWGQREPFSYLFYLLYLLVLPYVMKIYYLFLVIKAHYIKVQSVIVLDLHNRSLLRCPITLTYQSPLPIEDVEFGSSYLLTLSCAIEVLEKRFLDGRAKVLAGDDDKSYYDEGMDIVALYASTKERLRQCEAKLYDCEEKYAAKLSKQQHKLEKQLQQQLKQQLEQQLKQQLEQQQQLKQQLEHQLKQQLEQQLKKQQSKEKEHSKQLSEMFRNQLQLAKQSSTCCVCHDKEKCILLQPCNHVSLCEQCLEEVLARRDKVCPLCREKIEDHIRVFL